MKFLLAIVIVVIAMALKDVLGTAMTIYEARGNGHKAGLFDGLGDVANFVYMWVGVDSMNTLGFSLKGGILMLAVCVTSYNTTKFTVNKLRGRE